MLARRRLRARVASLTFLALTTAIWASAAPAGAAVTTTTVKCPTIEIVRGVSTTGATVSTPGAKTRTLDASQATAFMQTWLAYSVAGNPPQNHPPANLPVSRLTVPIVDGSQPQSLVVLYATDGTKVWVGAPAPTASAPDAQKWILAPKPVDTTRAFLGDLAPKCIDPVSASTSVPGSPTTTRRVVEKPTGTDDGATWTLIGVGVVIVAAIGFLVTRVRRRRGAHAR